MTEKELATNATCFCSVDEVFDQMVDWAFILKGSDGLNEPDPIKVRHFLKKLGRAYGLHVGFAPLPIAPAPAMPAKPRKSRKPMVASSAPSTPQIAPESSSEVSAK
jgi:hypothetical protein